MESILFIKAALSGSVFGLDIGQFLIDCIPLLTKMSRMLILGITPGTTMVLSGK
jgi:hypothetical protein